MAKNTLYNKIWEHHKIATLPTGQDQLFIGLHYMHEVTSPAAFAMLRESNSKVLLPKRNFATYDHVIPTDNQTRPFQDAEAELMAKTLEHNAKDFGINFFDLHSEKQGVVHVIGPELGITQPGMTIACGDSHTSTHGAFGSLAFGIGTTEVKDVLTTQTLALNSLKVRKIIFNGDLPKGVYAKDAILKVIQTLGVKGGLGFAYEYAGSMIDSLNMDDRMTICNMSIEGGARIGYINPDQTTFDYLKNREYAPKNESWQKALAYWESIKSDVNAEYDDTVIFDCNELEPMVTWGINPGQAIGVTENLPLLDDLSEEDRKTAETAYKYMKFKPGQKIEGTKIDVVFIGSCTNGRMTDFRIAAEILKGKKVAPNIKCLVVPGSQMIKEQAEKEGLDKIFIAAGAEWRLAGCSMCLAMNPDKLVGDQISASTSNRNFIGRQGSSTGRTLLLSPAMAAAAAIAGKIVDVRKL
ncbi:MAG: 3-isopropylmalate dehydratase large subunit [Candidatus Margulisiibacteriota bacterium]|jgi:3-isopropylmalate/(R)-2-methylmalate dehydratase large subunit